MALVEKYRNNPSSAVMSASQQGQSHDRMSSQRSRNSNDAVQTSITQKMLSAVTGSVLTSLLGTPYYCQLTQYRTLLTRHSNTSRRGTSTATVTNTVKSVFPIFFFYLFCRVCPPSTKYWHLSMLSRGLLGSKPKPVLRYFVKWRCYNKRHAYIWLCS